MRASRSRYAGSIGSSCAEQRADVLLLGVPAAEVLVEDCPGRATGSKVGFGMKRLTLPAHQQALPAVDHRPLHRARAQARLDVADEGVLGLVVVVVGVEGAEREMRHGAGLLSGSGPRSRRSNMNNLVEKFNEKMEDAVHETGDLPPSARRRRPKRPRPEPRRRAASSAAAACSRPRAPASARAASPAPRSARSRSGRASRTGCSTSSSGARSTCSRWCCARSSATGCARSCPRDAEEESASRALEGMFRRSVEFCRRHPLLPALLRGDQDLQLSRIREAGRDRVQPHRDLVASLLRRGIEAGEFKPDLDVASVADVICQLQADYSARAYRRDPGYPGLPGDHRRGHALHPGRGARMRRARARLRLASLASPAAGSRSTRRPSSAPAALPLSRTEQHAHGRRDLAARPRSSRPRRACCSSSRS